MSQDYKYLMTIENLQLPLNDPQLKQVFHIGIIRHTSLLVVSRSHSRWELNFYVISKCKRHFQSLTRDKVYHFVKSVIQVHNFHKISIEVLFEHGKFEVNFYNELLSNLLDISTKWDLLWKSFYTWEQSVLGNLNV